MGICHGLRAEVVQASVRTVARVQVDMSRPCWESVLRSVGTIQTSEAGSSFSHCKGTKGLVSQ